MKFFSGNLVGWNQGLAPYLVLRRNVRIKRNLGIPEEEFIYRLYDALEGSGSKSIYATDAKLILNSRINQFRTPITNDFHKVSDKATIQGLDYGNLIAGKVCKCQYPNVPTQNQLLGSD